MGNPTFYSQSYHGGLISTGRVFFASPQNATGSIAVLPSLRVGEGQSLGLPRPSSPPKLRGTGRRRTGFRIGRALVAYTGSMMTKNTGRLINETQITMIAQAEACGITFDPGYLRTLIRLVETFNADISDGTLAALQGSDSNETCDSIFAGVRSFWMTRDSLDDPRFSRGLSESKLTVWSSISAPEIISTFQESYRKFHSSEDFEHRVVFLCDLFKLLILWAAMNCR
jgi:hypothetical protein